MAFGIRLSSLIPGPFHRTACDLPSSWKPNNRERDRDREYEQSGARGKLRLVFIAVRDTFVVACGIFSRAMGDLVPEQGSNPTCTESTESNQWTGKVSAMSFLKLITN